MTHRVTAVQGVTAFFQCVQIFHIVFRFVSCIRDLDIHLPPSLSIIQESNFNAIIHRGTSTITAAESHPESPGSDVRCVLCILHKPKSGGVKDTATLKSNFKCPTRFLKGSPAGLLLSNLFNNEDERVEGAAPPSQLTPSLLHGHWVHFAPHSHTGCLPSTLT